MSVKISGFVIDLGICGRSFWFGEESVIEKYVIRGFLVLIVFIIVFFVVDVFGYLKWEIFIFLEYSCLFLDRCSIYERIIESVKFWCIFRWL